MVERVALDERSRPVGTFSREEIQAAFEHFQEAAARCGASGDWKEWSECFTEDATYYEHHYGRMEGRAAILEWINATMNEPVNSEMSSFPVDWYLIDAERGWVVCQVANVMDDPGDGSDHREYNWTLLHYAGDGMFSYEEDMYNPAEFGEMIKGWLAAKKAAAKN
jgi:SnoaL-like domain